MPTLLKSFRPALPAALLALSLVAGARLAPAQTSSIQVPYALGNGPQGTPRILEAPYNFVGRVFDLTTIGFGSGTLIRRHTVLTAGHVLYNSTTGFTTAAIFSRALDEGYSLQKSSVLSVAVLAGYQVAANTNGETDLGTFALDQGYVLVPDAPVDNNWANFSHDPTLLSNPTIANFVLGYPGVTFDGRTPAYIVPMAPYVRAGTAGQLYTNENYAGEPGMSGGPIFVEPDGTLANAVVAADFLGGVDDTSGEFNEALVRAIDNTSNKFLTAAEYTSGLIKKVNIVGPTSVQRGQTYEYGAQIVFKDKGTTDRYPELKLVSAAATALPGQSQITIKKTSNTTWNVTFPATLRSGQTAMFQIYYTKTATPLKKSSLLVKFL